MPRTWLLLGGPKHGESIVVADSSTFELEFAYFDYDEFVKLARETTLPRDMEMGAVPVKKARYSRIHPAAVGGVEGPRNQAFIDLWNLALFFEGWTK
jgi:hypothetical protein